MELAYIDSTGVNGFVHPFMFGFAVIVCDIFAYTMSYMSSLYSFV